MQWYDKQFVAGTTQSLCLIFPHSHTHQGPFLGMVWWFCVCVLCVWFVFITAFPAQDLESIQFRSTDGFVHLPQSRLVHGPWVLKISETSWKFLFPDVCIKAETSIVQVSCLFVLCPFLPCLMSRRSFNWNESLVLKLSTLIILSQSSPLKRPMKLTRSKFGAFFTNLSILLTSETPWHLDLKLPCASSS